jgi:thymidylate synthase (FAD)
MQIVPASFEILTTVDRSAILTFLELVGRNCYKSEDAITPDSAPRFMRMILGKAHYGIIEHFYISVRIICDRAISHEIVRHRIASYAQESTRYCDYQKEKFHRGVTFVAPNFWVEGSPCYAEWLDAMQYAEKKYLRLRELGAKPEEARSVLPNSTKTEIIATMNLSAWYHFFELRTAKAAHPQMREVTIPLLAMFAQALPEIFKHLMPPVDRL